MSGDDARFAQWAAWLAELPEADELLRWMLEQKEQHPYDGFHLTRILNGPTWLNQGPRMRLRDVPSQLFDALAYHGFLRPNFDDTRMNIYEVSLDAVRFDRWRARQPGAVEQTASAVGQLIDGAEFASRHPAAAQQLRDALVLATGDLTRDHVVAQIGGLLRGALVDVAASVVEHPTPSEDLAGLLKKLRRAGATDRHAAAVAALVNFVETTQVLDQAVTHVRDEQDKVRERVTRDEVRDSCFLTAVACYALDRLGPRSER